MKINMKTILLSCFRSSLDSAGNTGDSDSEVFSFEGEMSLDLCLNVAERLQKEVRNIACKTDFQGKGIRRHYYIKNSVCLPKHPMIWKKIDSL